jgi:hypothetical protein
VATSALTRFYCLNADIAHAKHKWDTDVIKLLLTNTAPVVTNTIRSNITEITAQNGYPANGLTLTTSLSSQTSGNYKLILADFTLNATGTIGPWRYPVLYNSTSSTQPLIGWYDYGSSITMANGEGFLFDFDGANGVLALPY